MPRRTFFTSGRSRSKTSPTSRLAGNPDENARRQRIRNAHHENQTRKRNQPAPQPVSAAGIHLLTEEQLGEQVRSACKVYGWKF